MPNPKGFVRLPGKLLRIKDLHSLELEETRSGDRNFYFHDEPINRIRVFGTVISKYENISPNNSKHVALSIDDGSDTISVQAWGDVKKLEDVNIGQIVDILGKVRYYNNRYYILFEEVSKNLGIDFEIKMRAELIDRDISVAGQINQNEEFPKYINIDEFSLEPTTDENESINEEEDQEEESEIPSQLTNEKKKELLLSVFKDNPDENNIKRLSKELNWPEDLVEAILHELQTEALISSSGEGRYEKFDF
jgi:hypothetical protein